MGSFEGLRGSDPKTICREQEPLAGAAMTQVYESQSNTGCSDCGPPQDRRTVGRLPNEGDRLRRMKAWEDYSKVGPFKNHFHRK